ncbi:hypothetical protein V8E36_007744 [Tilletia maclaganii]
MRATLLCLPLVLALAFALPNSLHPNAGRGGHIEPASRRGLLLSRNLTSSLVRRGSCFPQLTTGESCSSPEDCISEACIGGVCAQAVAGKGCAVDSDCLEGSCFQGSCQYLQAGATCSSSTQCASGSCSASVSSSSSGTTCQPIAKAAGSTCSLGTECASTRCVSGTCDDSGQGEVCTSDSDCGENGGPCSYYRCRPILAPCTSRTQCQAGICRGDSQASYCFGRPYDPCNYDSDCISDFCDQDVGMCDNGPTKVCPLLPLGNRCQSDAQCSSGSCAPSGSAGMKSCQVPGSTSSTTTTTSTTSTSTTTSSTSTSSTTTSTTTTTSTSSSTTTPTPSSTQPSTTTTTTTSTKPSSTSPSTSTTPKSTSTTTTTSSRTSTTTSKTSTTSSSALPSAASCTANVQCASSYCRKALLSDGVTRAQTGVCDTKKANGSRCYQNGGCISGLCSNGVCAAPATTTTRPTSTTTSTKTVTTTSTTNLPSAASCKANAQCSSGYCRKALLSDGVTRAQSGNCDTKKASGAKCYQNGGCTSGRCVSKTCA